MSPEEAEQLKAEMDAAQKVWAQRIEETNRARAAEQLAHQDVKRLANKCLRVMRDKYLTAPTSRNSRG